MAPSQNCHKEKSEKTYQVYDLVQSNITDFIEWEATILFYAALHCVNHFFASLPIPRERHPSNHDYTVSLVSRHLTQYALDYECSYNISRWARYFDLEITETMRNTCLRNYNAVKALIP